MEYQLYTEPTIVRMGKSPKSTRPDKLKIARQDLVNKGWEEPISDQNYRYMMQRLCGAGLTSTLSTAILAIKEIALLQPITVRGILYRVVQTGLSFSEINRNTYQSLDKTLIKLRRAGVVPYHFIADNIRETIKPSTWEGLGEFFEDVDSAYRKDFWKHLDHHVEVFVEKDAMAGVLSPISQRYDVRLNVIRGDVSDSYAYEISRRWKEAEKPIFAIYIGDFDPGGINIERVLRDKLIEMSGAEANWARLAVTVDDMHDDHYFLEAKAADLSTPKYIREWGWSKVLEIDAIPPDAIRQRLENAILEFVPKDTWNKLIENQKIEKQALKSFIDSWNEL